MASFSFQIKGKTGASLSLWLCGVGEDSLTSVTQPQGAVQQVMTSPLSVGPARTTPGELPDCGFINVELLPGTENGLKNPYLVPFMSTVLLENPKGENPIKYSQLLEEVCP